MRIAIVLPRNMHFGPRAATSIDLSAREALIHSRHGPSMTIVCEEVDERFEDAPSVQTFPSGSVSKQGKVIERHLHELDPDLVLVHQHLPSAFGLARRFRDRPVALYMHNVVRPTRGLRRLFRTWRFRHFAGLIFVSEAARQRFHEAYPNVDRPSFVVPNGLVASEWPLVEKRQEILAIGRVAPFKGSLEIAQALGDVLPDFPAWSARFIGPMAGEKGYAAAFETAVARHPRIAHEGALDFDVVRAACLRAEIAVVASRQEGFGRVAIEAFAARLALISTGFGGLDEVLGDCGLRLEEGSRAEIADALRRLMVDEDLRAELARRGRARFEKRFTAEHFAAALDHAIDWMLTDSGRAPQSGPSPELSA